LTIERDRIPHSSIGNLDQIDVLSRRVNRKSVPPDHRLTGIDPYADLGHAITDRIVGVGVDGRVQGEHSANNRTEQKRV
jgi:hypothetical protein